MEILFGLVMLFLALCMVLGLIGMAIGLAWRLIHGYSERSRLFHGSMITFISSVMIMAVLAVISEDGEAGTLLSLAAGAAMLVMVFILGPFRKK